MNRKRFSQLRRVLIAGLVLTSVFAGDIIRATAETQKPDRIVIASGANFEPFLFKNIAGEPEGIAADRWELWSMKTGVEVELRLMSWAETIPALLAGKVDAVDGVSYSAERGNILDLSRPYTEIPSYIYFHESIGGVQELSDLEGFPIGVLRGSQSESLLLKEAPLFRPLSYGSFREIVMAANQNRLRVFIGADPMIPFLFAKMGYQNSFRRTEHPINSGDIRTAVRKGEIDLLNMIEQGQDAISPNEWQNIQDKWAGVSLKPRIPWSWLLGAGSFLVGSIVLLILWNTQLQKRVSMATQTLRESERKLHAIFDHHYQLTGLIDTEGRVLASNRTALDFSGAKESEVIGRYLWDGPWWDPPQKPELRNAVERAARGEFVRFETTHPTADGEIRHIDFSLSPVRDDDGHVIYIVPEGRDITEIRRAEEGKALLQEQLIKAQKMEAIGTLAGGIAHDFNNILAAIIGFTEISMRDAPQESKLKDNLQRVLNASIRAGDLVKQILTFSRQTDREIKPVLIKSITKEALKLIRASLPATIEIEQNIQSESTVLADPTQIHQIIMNLCTNAAHAMQETGGKMRVKLTEVTLDEEFTNAYTDIDPGFFVKLSISDSGSGISSEIQDRIFDPFFTTKQPGQGTGLGLSVVHGIVKDSGGLITVESKLGQGTHVHVFLPRVETVTDEKVVRLAPLPTGTERILFVDDEPNQVDFGKQALELLGYSVSAITSSPKALDVFRSNPEAFDLVITDMTMPKMTGDKLAKEILAIRPDMPIIISTGYSERITPDTVNALGIRELIMKPAVAEQIATTVRRVLDQVTDKS